MSNNLNLSKLDEVLENIESQIKELRACIKGDVKPAEVEKNNEPELALEDVRKYLAELSRDGHTTTVNNSALQANNNNHANQLNPNNSNYQGSKK